MARLNKLYMPSSIRQQWKSRQVLCSVNYHASWNCRFLSTSLNRSGGIDGLGLGIESLALRCLTIHSAEAFDAQLLPGLCHCGGPSGDVLVGFLAGSMLLLGHNLVTLVLQQVCLFETCCSLLFAAPEDHGLCRLSSSNLAHCLLLHHSSFHRSGLLHCLHALHHGLLHGKGHVDSNARGSTRSKAVQVARELEPKNQETWEINQHLHDTPCPSVSHPFHNMLHDVLHDVAPHVAYPLIIWRVASLETRRVWAVSLQISFKKHADLTYMFHLVWTGRNSFESHLGDFTAERAAGMTKL